MHATRGLKLLAGGVAFAVIVAAAAGIWFMLPASKSSSLSSPANLPGAADTEALKIRKAVVLYPRLEAQLRTSLRENDRAAVRNEVAERLSQQLSIGPELLRTRLLPAADELKESPAATNYERAAAAYVERDFAGAERSAMVAATQAREAYPPNSGAAIQALELSGWSSQQAGDGAAALRHLRAAESLTDRDREPDVWARVQDAIAALLFDEGRFSIAESIWRDVLDVRTRSLGPDHFDTLRTRAVLAAAIAAQGNFAEAETEYRAVVANTERALGPIDPELFRARLGLADALARGGKRDEAKAGARKLVAEATAALGPAHPLVAAAEKLRRGLESAP